jgi:hypothetical protein
MAYSSFVDGDARDMGYAVALQSAKNGFRCKKCGRVCGWIEKDGICGAPKCRAEELEEQIDQLSLENRDLDIRLTKLEGGNK